MKFSLNSAEAKKEVDQLAKRIVDPQPMLKEIGLYMVGSVQRNFQESGRPVRWEPSQRAIAQHGKTLLDTNRLRNSVVYKTYHNGVSIGTNVIYAAIHNFGGKINKTVNVKQHIRYLRKSPQATKIKGKIYYPFATIKAHSMKMNTKIPKREFILIQSEDDRIIEKIAGDYLFPYGGSKN